jgi:hypothetical protein
MGINKQADKLVGTSHLPPYTQTVALLSRQAKAYHALVPYPGFSNMGKNWKTEDQGPYPRCRPFVNNIVSKGCTWLFGKPVSFRVSGDESKAKEQSKLVNDCWNANDMTRRSRVAAAIGAMSGGVVAKFSMPDADGVPRIDILDPAEQTRLYYDPENIANLIMARIQYAIFNAIDGVWEWYREDWTDDRFVTYKRLKMTAITNAPFTDPYSLVHLVDQSSTWQIESDEKNPFGIIPVWYIKNRDVGAEWGEGDLWAFFDIIDQINYTWNLAHVDNQQNVNGRNVFIDLSPQSEEGASAAAPGSDLALESTDEKTGQVVQLQTNAAIRPYLQEFADTLKQELLSAVGSCEFRPDEITNKGNLTSAVMLQMYAPLIERTGEKRQCYGEDGFCVFLERMSIGLSNLGVEGWSPMEDIQIIWPPYFEQTPDEMNQIVDREIKMIDAGLTTHDRAARSIAKAEQIQDVDQFVEDVTSAKAERDEMDLSRSTIVDAAMARQKRGLGA